MKHISKRLKNYYDSHKTAYREFLHGLHGAPEHCEVYDLLDRDVPDNGLNPYEWDRIRILLGRFPDGTWSCSHTLFLRGRKGRVCLGECYDIFPCPLDGDYRTSFLTAMTDIATDLARYDGEPSSDESDIAEQYATVLKKPERFDSRSDALCHETEMILNEIDGNIRRTGFSDEYLASIRERFFACMEKVEEGNPSDLETYRERYASRISDYVANLLLKSDSPEPDSDSALDIMDALQRRNAFLHLDVLLDPDNA